MSSPVWEKITANGKPFGIKDEETLLLEEKVKELEGYVEKLEEENKLLKEALEAKPKMGRPKKEVTA